MSLVQDSKAAHKLHMTYGQYMANVKPRVPIREKKKKSEANGRKCVLCGKPLMNKQLKYCTDCAYAYYPYW